MSAPIQLRPGMTVSLADMAKSPESLAISAMLATGVFNPLEHGLSTDDLACYDKLWTFAADYQERSGRAPGLDLIRQHFPDYVFIPGIDLNWAIDSLKDASYGRMVRREIHEILVLLGENDYATVVEKLKEITEPRRTHAIAGVGVFDPSNMAEINVKKGVQTPFATINDVTSGIGLDEVWVLGARTGHGKTNLMSAFAGAAAEQGISSRYLSIEMPAATINKKIAYYHARHDRELLERLKHRDETVRVHALAEMADRVPGHVEVIDPRSVPHMGLAAVTDATRDTQLLFIDHIGLLRDNRGVQAITDWRVMAAISNELREINLRTECGLIEASQLNREADKPGLDPPPLSTLSQSTAIEQDASVAILWKKPTDDFLTVGIPKNRLSRGGRFYCRYDPSRVDYREINRDEAINLKRAAEDRAVTA